MNKQMTHHETTAPAASLTPSDVWLQKQLEQIEQLQMLIIKQQGDLGTSLDQLRTQSIVLLTKISELEALTSHELTPALEKAINNVSAQAKAIDEQVPDVPPHD